MIKVNKINIKIIDANNELGNSRLEIKISGPNINYVVASTIRRTIMAEIPIYAFNEFKFDKNTSVFHNNYLKLRLKQLPVWGIENTLDFIDKPVNNNLFEDIIEENENENEIDQVELQVDKTLNSSTLKQMTMYINYKNNTNDIVNVTTSDAKFYYGEKQIQSPYSVAIPIVKLQAGQEIAFSAITKVGIESEDAMFCAVTICTYKQINDSEFDFIIESRGQINEKRILQVALINIEKRIRSFIKLLEEDKKNSVDKTNLEGIIIVNNEDHTLGNLISRGLQQHDKIKFAGYNLPHPLAKKVHFHYKIEPNSDIIKIMNQVVEYYSDVFGQIKKSVDSI
jgi:DNA-directed RNA polymerase subunit L